MLTWPSPGSQESFFDYLHSGPVERSETTVLVNSRSEYFDRRWGEITVRQNGLWIPGPNSTDITMALVEWASGSTPTPASTLLPKPPSRGVTTEPDVIVRLFDGNLYSMTEVQGYDVEVEAGSSKDSGSVALAISEYGETMVVGWPDGQVASAAHVYSWTVRHQMDHCRQTWSLSTSPKA